MAAECSQEAVLEFLIERGGRVKNVDLIERFKPFLAGDPARRAEARERFKDLVDEVGFVKMDNEVRYVCLKKKYMATLLARSKSCLANGTLEEEKTDIQAAVTTGEAAKGPRSRTASPAGENNCGETTSAASRRFKNAAIGDAKPEAVLPVSDYGTMRKEVLTTLRTPLELRESLLSEVRAEGSEESVLDKRTAIQMGNTSPAGSGGTTKAEFQPLEKSGEKEPISSGLDRDTCTRSGNSTRRTLSVEPEENTQQTVSTDLYEMRPTSTNLTTEISKLESPVPETWSTSSPLTEELTEFHSPPLDNTAVTDDTGTCKEGGQGDNTQSQDCSVRRSVIPKRRQPSRKSVKREQLPDGESRDIIVGETSPDAMSITPKHNRKSLKMISNSPQLMNRRSIQHSGRYKDSGKNESDSASLLSSTDEESGFVSLDPLEHEWMMCASNGQWEDLNRLLCCEPTLVLKRDFVTGFTCLHWAAKQGKQELIALLVNFAKQHDVLLNINARSSAGYTPLHLAVMHNHTEVIKLLVGAYDADVDIRDYSGKKAWQYLRDNVPEDIRDIAGAARNADPHAPGNGAGRWRFSRVLSSNLMPYKLMHVPEEDTYDGEMSVKSRMSYRKSTSVGSTRIRPRLNRIRFKTQIVHSISFRESEDEDRSVRSPTKSRPKSTLFG
ncbi:ankyrin repeat domain-containing protein SOWAHC [Erpetoichthys calabaricus]|uniref:ankyrin repeat domain-containing protein SOWAHC n=1 Tax=Erpetoichthys calabaricus TaxID=27687 RepID=UPI00223432E3|nr:ankyrin repeat domain-containing protein SOWAHC [Erpetoichthys calabaricus]